MRTEQKGEVTPAASLMKTRLFQFVPHSVWFRVRSVLPMQCSWRDFHQLRQHFVDVSNPSKPHISSGFPPILSRKQRDWLFCSPHAQTETSFHNPALRWFTKSFAFHAIYIYTVCCLLNWYAKMYQAPVEGFRLCYTTKHFRSIGMRYMLENISVASQSIFTKRIWPTFSHADVGLNQPCNI